MSAHGRCGLHWRNFLRRVAAVIDLGCGPGNSTELLQVRFPGAAVSGLDSSPDMMTAARKRLLEVKFILGDIAA